MNSMSSVSKIEETSLEPAMSSLLNDVSNARSEWNLHHYSSAVIKLHRQISPSRRRSSV
jgi:hypothetical protein